MACEECRDLSSHAFRGADDLVYAIRLAAEEVERGVLRRVSEASLRPAEQEALDSSLASGALPGRVAYRFQCAVCGDQFTLSADTHTGEGEWAREGDGERTKPLPR